MENGNGGDPYHDHPLLTPRHVDDLIYAVRDLNSTMSRLALAAQQQVTATKSLIETLTDTAGKWAQLTADAKAVIADRQAKAAAIAEQQTREATALIAEQQAKTAATAEQRTREAKTGSYGAQRVPTSQRVPTARAMPKRKKRRAA